MKQAHTVLLLIAWLLLALLLPWLVMGPAGPGLERLWAWAAAHLPAFIQRVLEPGWMHVLVFGGLVLIGGPLLRLAWPRLTWGSGWLLTGLVFGLVYKTATFLPDISTYPFSLGWSEGSRYYYASLFLSEKVYGVHVPPSVLHPSRYLMQAVPFLLTEAPIWLHRAWQVLLWLVTSGLTAWVLVRRAAPQQALPVRLVLALGAILFLFQGPVYYHLLVMVLLVLWAFDRLHPWRTLLVVALASLWAGISRVNWLPVPGLLAAALYFLEQPLSALRVNDDPAEGAASPTRRAHPWGKIMRSRIVRYLIPPAAWTILGSLLGWVSQQAYQTLSGNPPEYFGSSFSSDLLWYRLLPNPTYPLGILPSALLVSLPVLGLISLSLRQTWRNYHPLRLLGLGAILSVLFLGGVVVSVKIGGGSNLHNLDAYLVLLLVVGSLVSLNFTAEAGSLPASPPSTRGFQGWRQVLIGCAAAVPLLFAVTAGSPWPERDLTAAKADLDTLRHAAQQAVQNGGQVLLINQRHLLATGEMPGVPLEADYELVFLMEMAMAGNPAYLDAFHADLQAHKYALIIAEPLAEQYQGRAHSFGEENDAWVTQVSVPVLCNYQPLATLPTAGVVLYVPAQSTCP